jgi:hypothetical protein
MAINDPSINKLISENQAVYDETVAYGKEYALVKIGEELAAQNAQLR